LGAFAVKEHWRTLVGAAVILIVVLALYWYIQRPIIFEKTGFINHPWAGEYYRDNPSGKGEKLYVAPDIGFQFVTDGFAGIPSSREGHVILMKGILELTGVKKLRSGEEIPPSRLVVVAWVERRYLVPEKEVAAFCEAVKSGAEPRKDIHGPFFLRVDDEKKAVSGSPILPVEFQKFLAKPADPATEGTPAVGAPTTPGASEAPAK
jgi:hypothetical protein